MSNNDSFRFRLGENICLKLLTEDGEEEGEEEEEETNNYKDIE